MDVKLFFFVVLALCNTYQYVKSESQGSREAIRTDDLYKDEKVANACKESTLKSLPGDVKAAVANDVQSMLNRKMNALWSMRDAVINRVNKDHQEKYRKAAQRLKIHYSLGKDYSFPGYDDDRNRKIDFIRIAKEDIDQLVDDLKIFVTPGKPASQVIEKLLNMIDLETPANINACAAKLIFQSDDGCIKSIKESFEVIVEEIEKLEKALNFTVPLIGEELNDRQRVAVNGNFDELLKEANVNQAFSKTAELLRHLIVPGFYSTEIADKLLDSQHCSS